MSRKKFIESLGATCKNWYWSWSFINEQEKKIIFGAWDTNLCGTASLIFEDAWEFNDTGGRNRAYHQSREHIRLIEEEDYQLMTFPMIEDGKRNANGSPKIKKIIEILTKKSLTKDGSKWYASDDGFIGLLPEEIKNPTEYTEGASKQISVNIYERNPVARTKCIEHYGVKCSVCSFDFENKYGDIGKGFIHVHHLVPLSEVRKEYVLDPITDLRPVCANCHAMLHKAQTVLTIEQLKVHINSNNSQ